MANGYDRLSRVYDLLVNIVFGRSMKRAQFHFLSQIPPNSRILLIGGGTGWLLKEVLLRTQPKQVTNVESSLKMTALSQKAVSEVSPDLCDRVEFVTDEFEVFTPASAYDVVLTPFFLDLFPEPTLVPVMEKIKGHMNHDGIWIFSDFRYPKNGIKKIFGRILIRIMYLFFNVICGSKGSSLPPFLSAFEKIQAKEIAAKFFFFDMIQTRLFFIHRQASSH